MTSRRPTPTPLFLDAAGFFADLAADNCREFWTRERARYDAIRERFDAVLRALDGWGPWRVYRPHNDRRFAAAAAPYKTFVGAVTERSDGVGAFAQISAEGALVATGIPMPAKDQLPRLRDALADEHRGAAFERARALAEAAGCRVHGGRWAPLVRMPHGYPTDHPRAELLRWKGVEASWRDPRPAWTSVDEAAAAVAERLAAPDDLHAWVGAHVGPSSLTPEERFAPRRRAT